MYLTMGESSPEGLSSSGVALLSSPPTKSTSRTSLPKSKVDVSAKLFSINFSSLFASTMTGETLSFVLSLIASSASMSVGSLVATYKVSPR